MTIVGSLSVRIDLYMKIICKLSLVFAALLAISCKHTGIVSDAPVKFVRPAKSVPSLVCTDLRDAFPEVLDCSRIQVVNDTVLVLQDQPNDDNPYHFKAYSTRDFKYLGSFVRNGRGPGEVLYPHTAIKSPSERFLCMNDNSVGQACLVDIEESIKSRNLSVAHSYALPPEIVDWVPFPDMGQFMLLSEDKRLVFHLVGSDGVVSRVFDLYKGYNGERYLTHFSGMILHNENTGQIAEVMIFFPQLNFIDTNDGQVYSVAVNKDYRNWQSVMGQMLNAGTKEYYVGAASTPDYIFAAYKNVPISELAEDRHGTHIHIFDWYGNFLYDISVAENIENMTFDSRTGFLYAMDRTGGRIVRYDLSGVM